MAIPDCDDDSAHNCDHFDDHDDDGDDEDGKMMTKRKGTWLPCGTVCHHTGENLHH